MWNAALFVLGEGVNKTQKNSSTLPSHLHSAKDLLGISIKLVYLISTCKLPTASVDGIL